MMRKPIVFALASMALLSGCDTMNWMANKMDITSTSSAPASASTASQPVHAPVKTSNTLSSIMLDSQPGMVDENDLKQANAAEAKAEMAPVGQHITWNNAQSGSSGVITAVKEGYNSSGAYCRQFQETVTLGGQPKQGNGYACQQPDGSWKVVSQ
jgi:surface antigen